MARNLNSSLKLLLKLVNALFGALGLFLLGFGFWVFRIWQNEVADGSTPLYPIPWFVYVSFGVGVGLCLTTFIGYMAAHTANALCLSLYLVIIFVLMVSEIAFAADVYVNSDWEKDFPQDSTGMLDDIADYIESNTGTFRWVGLFITFAQVLSVLLTIMLRNERTRFVMDEEYMTPSLQPLLHPQCSSSYTFQAPTDSFAVDPSFPAADKVWRFNLNERQPELRSCE